MKIIHKNKPNKSLFNILVLLIIFFALPNIFLSAYLTVTEGQGSLNRSLNYLVKLLIEYEKKSFTSNSLTHEEKIISNGLNHKDYSKVRSDLLKRADEKISKEKYQAARNLLNKLMVTDPNDLTVKTKYASTYNNLISIGKDEENFFSGIRQYYTYDNLLNHYLSYAAKFTSLRDITDLVHRYRKNYNANEKHSFTLVVFLPDASGSYSGERRKAYFRPVRNKLNQALIDIKYSGTQFIRVDIENLMRQVPAADYEIKASYQNNSKYNDATIVTNQYSNMRLMNEGVYRVFGDDPKFYVKAIESKIARELLYRVSIRRVGEVLPASLNNLLKSSDWIFYFRNSDEDFSSNKIYPAKWQVGNDSIKTSIILNANCDEVRFDFPKEFTTLISEIRVRDLISGLEKRISHNYSGTEILLIGLDHDENGVRVNSKDPHVKWKGSQSCNFEITLK